MKNYLILIQPPFTQLNSPYPAIFYLKSFVKKRFKDSIKIEAIDLSIDLFHHIISENGIKLIFKLIEKKYYNMFLKKNNFNSSINNNNNNNDDNTFVDIYNFTKEKNINNENLKIIKKYLLSKDFYINYIDDIKDFLANKNLNFYHYLLNSKNYPFSINGNRILNELKYFISLDETKIYSTILIEDLAKLINISLDENFQLIKYNERKGISAYCFKEIENQLSNSFILDIFYKDLLINRVNSIINNNIVNKKNNFNNIIIAISIPFPGNVIPAFYTVKVLKNYFNTFKFKSHESFNEKSNYYFLCGGGYVNTELRYIKNNSVFNYFDFIVFDSGFSSLERIIKLIINGNIKKIYGNKGKDEKNNLFKNKNYTEQKKICKILNKETYNTNLIKTLVNINEKILCFNFDSYDIDMYNKINQNKDSIHQSNNKYLTINNESYINLYKLENEYIKNTIPDYSEIDLSKYITFLESNNKMYRIWSDSKYFKYFLAYGCYWHKCSFCDTSLDYIKNYQIINLKNLFEKLIKDNYKNSKKKKITMIHFVDESLPQNHLMKFALLNYIFGTKFIFWGNIRFEKRYTYDVANLLSFLGFIGATGGIEVPVVNILNGMEKGVKLEDIIHVLYNFKANNIATHSYLIYGYFNETDKDIINSMEIVRQLFENNIIDSGFWHKFVLTRHSTIYNKFNLKNNFILGKDARLKEHLYNNIDKSTVVNNKTGKIRKKLKVIEKNWDFASNDLNFENEKCYEKFGNGLKEAMNNWIEGKKINKKLQYWFDFKIPEPSIDKNFVKNILNGYFDKIDKIEFSENKSKKVIWLGSNILILDDLNENVFNNFKNMDYNKEYDVLSMIPDKYNFKNVSISWQYQNKMFSLVISMRFAIFLKIYLEKNSIKSLKNKYYIKNFNKKNIFKIVDLFVSDYNNNKIFSKFIDFKNEFEKYLNFPFENFIKSKNFLKLKQYGLLLI